jgi:hypothetical protein
MEVSFTNKARLCVAVVALAACGAGRAEYKCEAPPAPIDRRACEKAQNEGPEALRRFISRMQPIQSLYFFDYMTDAQLLAWRDARELRDTIASKQSEPTR